MEKKNKFTFLTHTLYHTLDCPVNKSPPGVPSLQVVILFQYSFLSALYPLAQSPGTLFIQHISVFQAD